MEPCAWFDSSIKFKGTNTHEVLQRLARQRSLFMFFEEKT